MVVVTWARNDVEICLEMVHCVERRAVHGRNCHGHLTGARPGGGR